MKKIIVLLALIFPLLIFSQNKENEEFNSLLKKCDLTFEMPKGFYKVPIVENKDVRYQFAMKDSVTNTEIRFYINSFADDFYGKIDTTAFNPNKMTRNFFTSIVLNASGQIIPNVPPIFKMEKRDIWLTYSADNGATSKFNPNSDFGKGYTDCIASIVQKNNVGFFCIFWLFNELDQDKLQILKTTSHTLRYNRSLLITENDYRQTVKQEWSSLKKDTFNNLLEKYNIDFNIPEDFEAIQPKENDNFTYQYAIKHKSENFEIRYYFKPSKNPRENTVEYAEDFLAVASLGISEEKLSNLPQIDLFPEEGVKDEFNADWGGTAAFVPKSKFGEGYEFCSINSVMKKDIGQIFFIFMFSDYKTQSELPFKCYHTVRFN